MISFNFTMTEEQRKDFVYSLKHDNGSSLIDCIREIIKDGGFKENEEFN